MKDIDRKDFSTRAVHAGSQEIPAGQRPVAAPLYPSNTFAFESMQAMDAVFAGEKEGYVYSRYGSPTVAAFEDAVASLECAEAAQSFASGMAALHVALLSAGVQSGTSVVAAVDVYGATLTLLRNLFGSLGVRTDVVDVTDLAQVEASLKNHNPVALVAEIISNPLLKVADVPALADLAHRYGAQLLIDNTFASPYLFNPLAVGADYSIHSATKYLGGHGDITAGVVASSRQKRKEMAEFNKIAGSVLGVFDAWLALRGLKTLPLRVQKQCDNALQISRWLEKHPRVQKVNYPGLNAHPQHALAERLFAGKGSGGVLSFEIEGADREKAFRFMEALQVCQSATTLGDVYTLVLHPATSSHRMLSPQERLRIGISEGLVRLSAGIESPEDLIADLDQAIRVAVG